MERLLSFLLYVACAGFHAYAAYYARIFIPELPIAKGIGGLYKFLTSWNLHLQTLYYYYAVIVTAFALITKAERSIFITFRDYIFGTLVFPVGTYVSIVFWAMYNFDRKVIYPPVMDDYVPVAMNHAWHTAVAVFPIMEILLVRHYGYPSRSKGYAGLFSFKLAYLLWVLYLGIYHNLWVYPFMKMMSNVVFAIFILISIAIDAGFFEIGFRLGKIKTPPVERSTSRKKKRN